MAKTLDAAYDLIADPFFSLIVSTVGANLVLYAVDRWRSKGAWGRP